MLPPPTALNRHSNSACRSRVAACKLLYMHCELRARCVHCMHAPCTDCTTTAFGRLTEEQAAERCARANGSMAAHLEAATRWHAAEVNLPTYLPTGASICLHTCLNTSVPTFPATCMPAYLPIPRCDCWAWSAPRSRRSVRRHGQKRLTRPPLGHPPTSLEAGPPMWRYPLPPRGESPLGAGAERRPHAALWCRSTCSCTSACTCTRADAAFDHLGPPEDPLVDDDALERAKAAVAAAVPKAYAGFAHAVVHGLLSPTPWLRRDGRGSKTVDAR